MRQRAGHGDKRKFVDQLRNFRATHLRPLQLTARDRHIPVRLRFAGRASDRHFHAGAHAFQHIQKRGALGVQADVFHSNRRALARGHRHQGIRRRREIAGDIPLASLERRPLRSIPLEMNLQPIDLDRHTHGLEKPLRMIARRHGFDDRGSSLRKQGRQQDAGLHLRRCHGDRVFDALQVAALNPDRRTVILPQKLHFRTHQFQRFLDPAHGPRTQRGIARKFRLDRKARDQTGQEPHPGPGVAQVERGDRLQYFPAGPLDGEFTVFRKEGARAQRFHGVQGVHAILGLQEMLHGGRTRRQSGKHGHTVRNALVTLNFKSAAHGLGGVYNGGLWGLCHKSPLW